MILRMRVKGRVRGNHLRVRVMRDEAMNVGVVHEGETET